MLLLVDENVPAQVAEVFRARGHALFLVTHELTSGAPDPV